MSDHPKISIISTVYNTGPYLRPAVESILAQTFTDFELLLVDDGSHDGSAAVCDALAQEDARIRVFHQPNGGPAHARNTGLDNARGDYIGMGWPERLDVVAWIERIVQADPEARILVFGESMGAATAMNVAGESLPANVKCIIEDCGYTSVWDEFSLQLKDVFGLPSFPLLDVANLVCNVRAGYDFHKASSVEQLKHATVPMLFIHGDQDTFVPYDMLDQNYEA